jgi:SH3-like domain-containing protein
MSPRALSFLAFLHLSVLPAPAQADGGAPAPVRTDTPSGQPVPRFLSLKYDETNCRIGPSTAHPVRYVFRREGAPVLVVAESVDHWRKIRDAAGDECWAHKVTLRAQTHVQTIRETPLRRKPSDSADAAAALAAGVLARIDARKDGWLKVSAGGAAGWIAANAVWGGAIARADPGN